MEAMQSSGGKEILQRIMQAYGFTMQKSWATISIYHPAR